MKVKPVVELIKKIPKTKLKDRILLEQRLFKIENKILQSVDPMINKNLNERDMLEYIGFTKIIKKIQKKSNKEEKPIFQRFALGVGEELKNIRKKLKE